MSWRLLVLALFLGLAACGDSDDDLASGPSEGSIQCEDSSCESQNGTTAESNGSKNASSSSKTSYSNKGSSSSKKS